jgi:hypothetical protein
VLYGMMGDLYMKLKKVTRMQRAAITLSSLLVGVGLFILPQMYFSYIEVKAVAEGCYNNGGFPIIEKSGLNIDYFYCDMD